MLPLPAQWHSPQSDALIQKKYRVPGCKPVTDVANVWEWTAPWFAMMYSSDPLVVSVVMKKPTK
jgi:hypothetical protein